MERPELKSGGIHYPETDGKPMAETDRHRQLMIDLLAAAKYHCRDLPDVYVSGNLLVYFVEGDPTESVAPDFFVVRGVPRKERCVYKIWEEGKGPEVVIELTSTKTHREDLGDKRGIYEQLGVLEYFLFDPEGIRFDPQLRGFRLEGGLLRPVSPERTAGGTLVLSSTVLGLELHGMGNTLRLVDPRSGKVLPTPEDFIREAEAEKLRAAAAEQRAGKAEQRAGKAEQRAAESEQEIARLREELRRLRGDKLP
jgi:Uma2 family endonuclease